MRCFTSRLLSLGWRHVAPRRDITLMQSNTNTTCSQNCLMQNYLSAACIGQPIAQTLNLSEQFESYWTTFGQPLKTREQEDSLSAPDPDLHTVSPDARGGQYHAGCNTMNMWTCKLDVNSPMPGCCFSKWVPIYPVLLDQCFIHTWLFRFLCGHENLNTMPNLLNVFFAWCVCM
jgi:hypothetical protein